MPDEWSPDELRAILALEDELRPFGTLVKPMTGPRYFARPEHEAYVRARCAAWLSDEATIADGPSKGLLDDIARRLAAGKPLRGPLTQHRIAEKHNVSRRQVRKLEDELGNG